MAVKATASGPGSLMEPERGGRWQAMAQICWSGEPLALLAVRIPPLHRKNASTGWFGRVRVGLFPANVVDLGLQRLEVSVAPWHNDSGDDCAVTND